MEDQIVLQKNNKMEDKIVIQNNSVKRFKSSDPPPYKRTLNNFFLFVFYMHIKRFRMPKTYDLEKNAKKF